MALIDEGGSSQPMKTSAQLLVEEHGLREGESIIITSRGDIYEDTYDADALDAALDLFEDVVVNNHFKAPMLVQFIQDEAGELYFIVDSR